MHVCQTIKNIHKSCFFQVFQATGGDKSNRKQMTNALIMMFLPSIAKALKLEMFDTVSLNPLFYF